MLAALSRIEADDPPTIDDLIAIPRDQILFARVKFYSLNRDCFEFMYSVTCIDGQNTSCILALPHKNLEKSNKELISITSKRYPTYAACLEQYNTEHPKFMRFLKQLSAKQGFFVLESNLERPSGIYRDRVVLNANAIDSYRPNSIDENNSYRGLHITRNGCSVEVYSGDGISDFITKLVGYGHSPHFNPITLNQEETVGNVLGRAQTEYRQYQRAINYAERAHQMLGGIAHILDTAAESTVTSIESPTGPIAEAIALRKQLVAILGLV